MPFSIIRKLSRSNFQRFQDSSRDTAARDAKTPDFSWRKQIHLLKLTERNVVQYDYTQNILEYGQNKLKFSLLLLPHINNLRGRFADIYHKDYS